MLKSGLVLMYSKLNCMKGTCRVSAMASTSAEVAGVTGPNTPATPGCTKSHRDLLPLKLSSVGYLVREDQTSVVMIIETTIVCVLGICRCRP